MTLRPFGSARVRRAVAKLGACLVFALVTAAGQAWAACAPVPDTDGDGICDPVDNCLTVVNPDQLDTYGAVGSPAGAFGDACEPIEAEVNVVKVKVRGGPASALEPKGKITIKGDFVLLPGEVFAPSAIATRVVDGLGLDQAAPAAGAGSVNCTSSVSGRSVRCRQAVQPAAAQVVAKFTLPSTSSAVSRVVKVSVKILKVGLGGMAFSEPVTVTLSDLGSGIDRVGVINDCAASNGQLRCREL